MEGSVLRVGILEGWREVGRCDGCFVNVGLGFWEMVGCTIVIVVLEGAGFLYMARESFPSLIVY